MTLAQVLAWAKIGADLVNVLKVPVAAVIQLFKDAGGTDEEAQQLLGLWHSLGESIDARIAELKLHGA